MMVTRSLQSLILADAVQEHKMAFVVGPRQVGKTFLAKKMIQSAGNYFNWDDDRFKRLWLKNPLEAIGNVAHGPIVIDEIHKYKNWKNSLKGVYDHIGEKIPMIVTGSARLDWYKSRGDSLMGRYFPYRLYPLTVAEAYPIEAVLPHLVARKPKFSLDDILQLSGFPEPLLGGSEKRAQRWSRLRREQILRVDIFDWTNIREIDQFSLLMQILPERVGAPLSINNLREDLQTAYATIRNWVSVLEKLYFCFKVPPWKKSSKRSVQLESKYYVFDILPIKNRGARFENVVALHLLKFCHFLTDSAQGEFELCYIRTREQEEVDFCVLRDGTPWMLVECKLNDSSVTPSLAKFAKTFPKAQAYLVTHQNIDKIHAETQTRILSAERFLGGLG